MKASACVLCTCAYRRVAMHVESHSAAAYAVPVAVSSVNADVLGGMHVGSEGTTTFIDTAGNPMPLRDLIVIEPDGLGYDKLVTKIKTPKVRAPRHTRKCANVPFTKH